MNGFLGEYESKLDAKGRFLFPARFKKQLSGMVDASPKSDEPQFVLNRGFEKCLTLFPMHTWEPVFNRIAKLNDFDPKVRAFRRYFLNGAVTLDLDSAGRLLIPKNLGEYAGLGKEMVLASAMNKIEIWDKNTYRQTYDTNSFESFSDIANQVMNGKDEE